MGNQLTVAVDAAPKPVAEYMALKDAVEGDAVAWNDNPRQVASEDNARKRASDNGVEFSCPCSAERGAGVSSIDCFVAVGSPLVIFSVSLLASDLENREN